jgi:hypothetical protein
MAPMNGCMEIEMLVDGLYSYALNERGLTNRYFPRMQMPKDT